MLDRPLSTLYRRKDLDIGFCLCWANETWSRRWDGSDADVLIPQVHTPESDKRFFEDVVRYMDDPRYITIDGRPVLVVYRSELLVDAGRTVEHWRNVALKALGKDVFLLRAMSFNPRTLVDGFDASVEFPPHFLPAIDITVSKRPLNSDFSGRIYDYPGLLPAIKRQWAELDFPFFPAVMTGWDNTARRGKACTSFHGSTPADYAAWVAEAAHFAKQNPIGGSSYVFINAWNEWAEGAHLEPDQRFGHAYLRATADVLRPYCAERRSGTKINPAEPRLRQRTCILVAGMHRSGTSATTRVVNLLGADIASDLVHAIPGDNDRGFWESHATYRLHDRLFAAFNSAWHDPYPLPEGWQETDAAREAKRAICEHIEKEFADSRMFVVKDPRVSRVLPLWLDALEELAIAPIIVIPFRNPLEVASSLEQRDGLPLANALLVYIQAHLEAERASRGHPRMFYEYEELISNWRPFADKLARMGGPTLNPAIAGEIDSFLSLDLRRQRRTRASLASLPEGPTLGEMYDRMVQAAVTGDEAPLRTCFDRVRGRIWEIATLFRSVASVQATNHRDEVARLEATISTELERRDAELDVLRTELARSEARIWRVTAPLRVIGRVRGWARRR